MAMIEPVWGLQTQVQKGMPYGGMPRDSILLKLEETDPELFPSRLGDGLTGDPVKNFMVGEILDRRSVPGFLESDEARRNPQISRETLNMRYGGTRGSEPDLPRNPEFFYAFLGNDPRGADTQPRFDELRRHTMHRAGNLQVAMGDNVGYGGWTHPDGTVEADHQVAERPWTGPAMQKARVDGQVAARNYLKVFSTSKEGRQVGQDAISWDAARLALGYTRRATVEGGADQWRDGTPVGALGRAAASRDDARVSDLTGFATRRDAQRPRRGRDLSRATEATGTFSVAQYGRTAAGRGKPGGGKERRAARADGELGQSRTSAPASASQRALAAAMSAAARSRRAAAGRTQSSATGTHNEIDETAQSTRAGEVRAQSVAVARLAVAQHTPGKEEMSGRPGGSGALPARAGQHAAGVKRLATPGHAAQELATNLSQSARGGQRTHGDSVRSAYEALAVGARAAPLDRGSGTAAALGASGRTVPAAGGNDANRRQGRTALRAHAVEGHVAKVYSGAPLSKEGGLSTRAAHAGGASVPVGLVTVAQRNYTQKRPEYRGATQTADAVSTEASSEIKARVGEAHFTGHHSAGRKKLRGDGGGLHQAPSGESLDDSLATLF